MPGLLITRWLLPALAVSLFSNIAAAHPLDPLKADTQALFGANGVVQVGIAVPLAERFLTKKVPDQEIV